MDRDEEARRVEDTARKVVELTCEMTRLAAENRLLRLAATEAQQALQWCSGEPDFCPGGAAALGWAKSPAVALRLLDVALAPEVPRGSN